MYIVGSYVSCHFISTFIKSSRCFDQVYNILTCLISYRYIEWSCKIMFMIINALETGNIKR